MANKKDKETVEMIEVFIPLDRSNEKNDKYYCSVNGVAMLIPMGKHVKVPAQYAYAIQNVQKEAELIRNQTRGN